MLAIMLIEHRALDSTLDITLIEKEGAVQR